MDWLRGVDLNHRPLGYEPNELPDCSTPQSHPTVRIPGGQRCRLIGALLERKRFCRMGRTNTAASGPMRPYIGGYNGKVRRLAAPAFFALAAFLFAQTSYFPLKDVKAGLRGTGLTVFSGNKIEEFQVEILGVLDNIGPKESLILARLSGGPLDHTGVMQGMSGSPVYINRKLLGAVAMAFPFSKDPIAGIRPIEDMVRSSGAASGNALARAELPSRRGTGQPPIA